VIVSVGFLLNGGCRDKSPESSSAVIAESGNAKLHLHELKTALPEAAGLEISTIQLQNYIQRWVENELIYQEAVKQGFTKDPEVQRKLEKIEKEMIAAWYVDQEIDKVLTVEEREISTFYDQSRSEYIRQTPSYDLQLILTQTINEANECREALTTGADFAVVARESSLDASKTKEGKIGWSTLNNFPEEVRRRIPTMRSGEISQPIQTSIGYYVIKVLAIRAKGEVQALDEVRDLIVWKIKAGKREEKYRQLIKQLRESNTVDIHWNMMDSLNIELK